MTEQRGLCAYCTRSLADDSTTTVEHWRARSAPGTDPFAWEDLLAVCPGWAGSVQTCDRRRGNRPLALHPARPVPDVEQEVRFHADGRARVADEHRHEVCEVLGLDAPLLVRARKQALDAVLAQLRRVPPGELLAIYEAPDGRLPPFPTLALAVLRKAAARKQSRSRRTRHDRDR
jgi:uncharacterized protein (TIGR02646 family)